MIRPVYLLLILPFVLVSCTLEQRHYRSGFYIDRGRNHDRLATEQVKTLHSADVLLTSHQPEETICENKLAGSEEFSASSAVLKSCPAPQEMAVQHDYRDCMSLPLITSRQRSSVYKDTIYVASAESGKRLYPRDLQTAKTLLYLGIALTFVFGGGFLLFPFATYFGVQALKKIRAYPDKFTGEVQARRVIIASSAIMLAILLLFVFLLVFLL